MNHGIKLVKGVELRDRAWYKHLVGKLIYLSHTIHDIPYAIGILSQLMHKPQVDQMESALRVLRYVNRYPCSGVSLRKNGHLQVEAYTNVNWAGNSVDRRSTSGYFTLVGKNLVT